MRIGPLWPAHSALSVWIVGPLPGVILDPRQEPAPIRQVELEDGETSMRVANAQAVRSALEAAGILFLDADAGVHDGGVVLKPGTKPRAGLVH
jgi:hypothetical protein